MTSFNSVDVVTDSGQLSDTEASNTTPTTDPQRNQLTTTSQPTAPSLVTQHSQPSLPTQNAADVAHRVRHYCLGHLCQHPSLQLIS